MSNRFLLMFLCFRFLFLESSILCFLSLLLLLNLIVETCCEHSGVTRAHNSLTLNQPWPHNAVSKAYNDGGYPGANTCTWFSEDTNGISHSQ